jgi:myosin heavy chain 6/7
VQAQALNTQLDKRQRQFDKAIDEWKRRVADQQTEIERWQKESRNQAAEAYRVRGQVEEAQQAVEVMRKENKNLTGKLTLVLCCLRVQLS